MMCGQDGLPPLNLHRPPKQIATCLGTRGRPTWQGANATASHADASSASEATAHPCVDSLFVFPPILHLDLLRSPLSVAPRPLRLPWPPSWPAPPAWPQPLLGQAAANAEDGPSGGTKGGVLRTPIAIAASSPPIGEMTPVPPRSSHS